MTGWIIFIDTQCFPVLSCSAPAQRGVPLECICKSIRSIKHVIILISFSFLFGRD